LFPFDLSYLIRDTLPKSLRKSILFAILFYMD